jgi:predicted alpha/beta hydrolase family esterase
LKINYNVEKIKANTNSWDVLLSKNDEYITYDIAKKYFSEIGVNHIDFENA